MTGASRRAVLRAGPALIAATALSACASPPTNYYRLAALPGAIRTGAPKSIEVRSVSIPGYLDQNGIARPSSNYQVQVYGNDIWAEPLSAMLQAVMVQDLSQRLPASTIIASSGSIGSNADLLIEMNVLQFDPDNAGRINLSAQIGVRSGATRALLLTQAFQTSAAPGSVQPADLAAGMSTIWGAAADEVAGLVIQAWASQAGLN